MPSCARGCCPDQATHFRSIQMSGKRSEKWGRQRQFEKDGAAYRRLRKNGVQPKQIDGSAQLEKLASTEQEIKMGRILA